MPDPFDVVRKTIDLQSGALSTFDYLIACAEAVAFRLVPRLSNVRSIELKFPDRDLLPYSIQVSPRHVNFYLRGPILKQYPKLFAAAESAFGIVKPNKRGEYRKHLKSIADVDEMLAFLRREGAWRDDRASYRFTASTFDAVTGEHLLRAAQSVADGGAGHDFGPSTDYDLLFDEHRLPPKAVFGLAASEALGFPVRPRNFSAGEGQVCFRKLRENGYEIVRKDEFPIPARDGLNDADRTWAEGHPRLISHLRRERGAGLASAKREQFRRIHGRLFCERCNLDPISEYGGLIGEACIEVHHDAVQLAEMQSGHQTRLEDLKCLCANCHRVVHRMLKGHGGGQS